MTTRGAIECEQLVLACGARELMLPFPGWTLPGVMTCGGMSNLFKDSSLSPAEPVVLAGSGPLLWLVAEHLFALDAPVAAILDTTPVLQVLPALKHMPQALRRFGFLLKGVRMIVDVQLTAMKRKVPIHRGVTGLRAEGNEKLERVLATCRKKELSFTATTLLVSEGIIPKDQTEDLVCVCGVFIHWEAADDQKIYQYNYEATKLSIARAMITEPAIVLADEPTANLDSKNSVLIMDLLSEHNRQGGTIIMVTHAHKDASYAHRIINLLYLKYTKRFCSK